MHVSLLHQEDKGEHEQGSEGASKGVTSVVKGRRGKAHEHVVDIFVNKKE